MQAKYNLYEICFKQLLRYFKLTDKKIESVVGRIHQQHQSIFNDLMNIIATTKETKEIIKEVPSKKLSEPQ